LNPGKKAILEKGTGQDRKQAKLTYLYEKESRYFAQVSETVKDLAVKELRELGAAKVRPVYRGVCFTASRRDFYRITYFARLLSRVLAPLAVFECKDKDELYARAGKIRWEEFLTPKKTFSITANVSESKITHSNFAGLRVKDAIADYFRDRSNRRPDVDAKNPYITVNLHLHRDMSTLSIDPSGGTLHKRGYREESVSAPMQETIAAAIIQYTRWNGEIPLVDPMCGSGTLICEALMHQCSIPPGLFRKKFGFESLPDFDRSLWIKIKKLADEKIKPLSSGLISGSDISAEAVQASRTNLMGIPHGNQVIVEKNDFREIPELENRVIVTNPPYGIRMGTKINLDELYKSLGDFLKQKCKGSTAYIYFGDRKFIKQIGLKPSWKIPIKTGGLDGRLVKYEMY